MVYVVWSGKYVSSFENVMAKNKNSIIWKDIGAELTQTYKKFEKKLINDTTNIALDSVKSTVPFHYKQGGTLRNQHIEKIIVEGTNQNYGRVYVDDRTHEPPYNYTQFFLVRKKAEAGTYTFNRPPASTLAELLETEPFKRTADSNAESGYAVIRKRTPTAGWVEIAGYQADKYIKRYLASDYDLQTYAGILRTEQEAKLVQQQQSQTLSLRQKGRAAPVPNFFNIKTGFKLGKTSTQGASEAEETGVQLFDTVTGLPVTRVPTTYARELTSTSETNWIRKVIQEEDKKDARYKRAQPTPAQDVIQRVTGEFPSGSPLYTPAPGQSMYDYYKKRYGK